MRSWGEVRAIGFQYKMLKPNVRKHGVKSRFFECCHTSYTQVKTKRRYLLRLFDSSSKTMKDPFEFSVMKLFYQGDRLINTFAAMDHDWQIIFLRPVCLDGECFFLLLPKRFIPIQIGPDLSYRRKLS